LLPAEVGGVELTTRSLNGESLVGGDIVTGGTVAGELGVLVDAPGDVSVALAVPATGDTPLLVAAYRLSGVGEAEIDDFLAGLPPEIWTRQSIDGRNVLVSVPGSDGGRSWLLADEAAGDGLLFQVESTGTALSGRSREARSIAANEVAPARGLKARSEPHWCRPDARSRVARSSE
jgi:hypothetical protein